MGREYSSPTALKKTLEFWRLYRKNRMAVFGLIVLFSSMAIVSLEGYLAPGNPIYMWQDTFLPPFTDSNHPLGTDDLGRDIYGELIHGTRVSLIVGLLGAAISTFIGVLIGSIGGYYGGAIEAFLMRITDFMLILPRLLLALVIVAFYGQTLWNIIIVIGLTGWPPIARITYGEFLSLKERPFVEAAHAIGSGNRRIILRDIMPNAAPPIIVNASLGVGSAILAEAALSYFGLGDQNIVSWGLMLNWAQTWISKAWWMAFFPGVAIFLMVLSFNLIGDGLNDALNPRLKER